MKNKFYILTLVLLLVVTGAYSQEINCATAIKEAEELYKNGNYENALQLINSLLKSCTLSKREKEDAYILLAQAYLEKENYDEANRLIIKILNNDPNFKVKENLYQEDFYAYYNRTTIRPMLAGGLYGGTNLQRYSVKNVYSVLDSGNYSADYKSKTGYQFGAFAEYWLQSNLSLVVDGGLSKIGYERTINNTDKYKTKINYSEQLKSFETSLCVKKYFLTNQFKPFVFIGGYFTNLRSAVGSVNLEYKLKDKITPDIDKYYLSKNNIDVLAMRNKNRQGITFGGGLSYKLKNFLVTANAGYRIDIGKHLINSAKRLQNNDLLFKYYYVDNDVNLNRFDVSLSVSYIIKYSIKSK